MRSRLYLLAVLGCVFALSSTTWSYDRPYVLYDDAMSNNTNPGDALDDHPWGEDQSIANPNTNPDTNTGIRPHASAIARFDMFVLQARFYLINVVSRWSFTTTKDTPTQPGTTTGTVPTTNSTTVNDGVR